MFVDSASDGPPGEGPFLSPRRPRLADPEIRSRVAGYLWSAPAAGSGLRTDGAWVWPEVLAEMVTERGAGPRRELVAHVLGRAGEMPADVGDAVVTRAVAIATTAPPPVEGAERYVVRFAAADVPTLIQLTPAGAGDFDEATLSAHGWIPTRRLTSERGALLAADTPVPDRVAARVADELCNRWHAELLAAARESLDRGDRPRPARLFDGESPAGVPWFSPSRRRIIEPERRRRLAAYLSGGRLALRATGRMIDPLEPDRGPVVPLNFRTDGGWVWPEALSYYVQRRGVAPELDLLCHIEDRGGRLPEAVPDDRVRSAVAAVQSGQQELPAQPGPEYFLAPQLGERLVRRVPGSAIEVLSDDLRWRSTMDSPLGQLGPDFRRITETEAVRIVDGRWLTAAAAQS